MAQVADCIITQSEEDKGAYGVRVDTDEFVYFPFKLSKAAELVEFDRVKAVLVPNENDRTPWRAVHVKRIGEE